MLPLPPQRLSLVKTRFFTSQIFVGVTKRREKLHFSPPKKGGTLQGHLEEGCQNVAVRLMDTKPACANVFILGKLKSEY